jgi:hypothetical protein
MVNTLTRRDIEDIVWGATLLGTGGGGPPYIGKIMALQALRDGRVELVEPDQLGDSDRVIVSFGMGSPVAHNEKWLDIHMVRAIEALERYLGWKADAVIPFEQGGGNTPAAIYTAAKKGVPLVDGDGVGRAVPELQMTIFHMKGLPISPMAVADAESRVAILEVDDAYKAENLARAITIEYGFLAGGAAYPMEGRQLKEAVVPGTVTLAREIGRVLRESVEAGRDYVEELLAVTQGHLLIRGEVVSVTSKTVKGFDFGVTVVRGEGEFAGRELRVDFKNENLLAREGDRVRTMAPDLICMVDDLKVRPFTNVEVRAGLKVAVLGIPANPRIRGREGYNLFRHLLELMGYRGPFIPVEEAVKG